MQPHRLQAPKWGEAIRMDFHEISVVIFGIVTPLVLLAVFLMSWWSKTASASGPHRRLEMRPHIGTALAACLADEPGLDVDISIEWLQR
jgi:hypothetical protein